MLDPENGAEKLLHFTDHLDEFRTRLIIVLVTLAVSFAVGFGFAPKVVEWLIQPLASVKETAPQQPILTLQEGTDGAFRIALSGNQTTETTTAALAADTTSTAAAVVPTAFSKNALRIILRSGETIVVGQRHSSNLFFLSPFEPFFLWVQGALLFAAVVTIPMVVFQVWRFISPGLLSTERRIAGPIVLASVFLFPLGAAFAYYLSHAALQILLSFGDAIPGLEPNIVASKYIGFILMMMLAFGVVFEFPLVLLLLAQLGVVTSQRLSKSRRTAIVIMAFVAAFITPTPDPFTMMAMLVPLLLFYEISILIIKSMERARLAAEREAGLTDDSI